MNKTEIVNELAKQLNEPKTKIESMFAAFIKLTTNTLKNGDSLHLPGVGILEISHRAARNGRNPQTGEIIKIHASKSVKFKVSKSLKETINE